MSSSAITPSTNLANFANASQAGIVSTTAQTFGGAKVFDGGALIKGITNGALVSSGYIGEIVEYRQETAQNASSGNYIAIPITIPSAGLWDVHGIIQFQTNGASSITGPWSAAITLQDANPPESFLSYTTSPNSTALTQTVRVRYDGTTMAITGLTSQNQNFVYLRGYPGGFAGGTGAIRYKFYIRAARVA